MSVTMCLQYFKLLFIFCLLIIIKGENDCGLVARPKNNRIVGGEVIGYVKYPWYAALVLSTDPKRIVCGGTLISKRYVVTAAHCYKPFFEKAKEGSITLEDVYIVKLGLENSCIQDKNVQIISTYEVYIHKDYYSDLRYSDIALIELEVEVNFMPACLPPGKYESNNRTGLDGTIVGLGKESSSAWRLPCQVKETVVEVQADSVCRAFLANNQEDGNAMHDAFCAGYGDGQRDTCQGDSGGPLQITMEDDRIIVLGVTSFGFGCAIKDTYGVYTDVSHYLDWIYSKMKSVQKSITKNSSVSTTNINRQLPSTTENPPKPKLKRNRNILQEILNW